MTGSVVCRPHFGFVNMPGGCSVFSKIHRDSVSCDQSQASSPEKALNWCVGGKWELGGDKNGDKRSSLGPVVSIVNK